MKILIIKTSSLGDIIHAYPALSYLRKKFPDVQIDWVAEKSCASLLHTHPYVNHVFEVDTRLWRKNLKQGLSGIRNFRRQIRQVTYDVVFDFQGNIKSGLILKLTRSKHKVGFGWNSVPEWPNCLFTNRRFNPPKDSNVRAENLFLVQSYFNDKAAYADEPILLSVSDKERQEMADIMRQFSSSKPKVLICPGSAWINKQVSIESLRDLLNHLHHKNCVFFFAWGTEAEKSMVLQLAQPFKETSCILEKLSLPLLQNLMDQMYLVVAMDSLPLHLAGTTHAKTLSAFGPSSLTKYKPIGEQHHGCQGKCPYDKTFERRCPILRSCSTGLCIKKITGKQLFSILDQDLFKI